MTQEEKARAYDEALKRADSLTEKYGGREFAEYVFPELAESEDERIRTELLSSFKGIMADADEDELWYGLPYNDIIAWLEKQKEQKPAEWSDYKDKVNVPYCSSEPEWSEEDEHRRKDAVYFLESAMKHYADTSEIEKAIAWLKSLSLNLKKRNEDAAKLCSNEWSEEDERIRKAILGFVNPDKGGTKYSSNAELVEWSDWLKSLRPQPKQEWSEEDETMWSNLIWYLEGKVGMLPSGKERYIKWLKERFVKLVYPKSGWKPSEEQMKRLLNIEGFLRTHQCGDKAQVIADLYEQLKK